MTLIKSALITIPWLVHTRSKISIDIATLVQTTDEIYGEHEDRLRNSLNHVV